jgi:sulfatase maturation enzyme AslB (radical SAM superfamily)
MIHGGLHLSFDNELPSNHVIVQNCCLRSDKFLSQINQPFWKNSDLQTLRTLNKKDIWDPGCANCQQLEDTHNVSFRQGTNQGLGIFSKTDLTGPSRIDLKFDISCNLACRTCGTHSSTFWQKHLKNHGLWKNSISAPRRKQDVIAALQNLDLSNLKQLVFCGGETLLGQEYWDVANWLGDNVTNAKQQLTLCFQTNGTQTIDTKNFKIIDKFHLVKLHISLDGVENQFEYLRWPALWNQVVDNIFLLKETLPTNVMFVIEETISIFNLFYMQKLQTWIQSNFTTNREGDVVNHTRHLANGLFSLEGLSEEYVTSMQKSPFNDLISKTWSENPEKINKMLHNIKQFDQLRNQDFGKYFPEVQQFYSRFL